MRIQLLLISIVTCFANSVMVQSKTTEFSPPDTLSSFRDLKWSFSFYYTPYTQPTISVKKKNPVVEAFPLGKINEVRQYGTAPINASVELNYRFTEYLGASIGFKYSSRQMRFSFTHYSPYYDVNLLKVTNVNQFFYGMPLYLTARLPIGRTLDAKLSLGLLPSYIDSDVDSSKTHLHENLDLPKFSTQAYFRPELKLNYSKRTVFGLYGTVSADIFANSKLDEIEYNRFALGVGLSVEFYLTRKKNTVIREKQKNKVRKRVRYEKSEFSAIYQDSTKKHLFSVNFSGAYPALHNDSNIPNQGDEGYSNWFSGGFKIDYSYLFSMRFMLGFEYGMEYSKFKLNSQDIYFDSYAFVPGVGEVVTNTETYSLVFSKHPGVQFHTHSFVPKIEWKIRRGIMQDGFAHETGLGMTLSYPIIKDYKHEFPNITPEQISMQPWLYQADQGRQYYMEHGYNSLYNTKNKPFFGLQLFYGIKYRKMLIPNLLLNLGLRAQFNYPIGGFDSNSSFNINSEYWINREGMRNSIVNFRLASVFRLNVGLTYCL